MAQLYFEPAASKIGADTYIVVPKNNSDTIDVAEYDPNAESQPSADVKTGAYRFIAKCSEVVKDVIFGLYGNPVTVNGVLTGHSHSADIVQALIVKYGSTYTTETATVDGESVTGYPVEIGETTRYYETQAEAFEAIVNYVKRRLRAVQPSANEEEVEENES